MFGTQTPFLKYLVVFTVTHGSANMIFLLAIFVDFLIHLPAVLSPRMILNFLVLHDSFECKSSSTIVPSMHMFGTCC